MTVQLGEERRYALGPVFLLALFFMLVAPVFWRLTQLRSATIPEAYENADLYHEIYPAASYGFDQIAQGHLPLWNPKQLCGAPFLADPRSGLFQPLNALFLILPAPKAMAAHAFLSLMLMGVFFTLFARAVGLRYAPALLGGVVYAFCGASVAAISRPAAANTLVWSAFTLWAMREYVVQFRYRTAALAGIGVALMALSGANAIAGAMLGLLVLYMAVWCVFPQYPPATRWRNGSAPRPFPALPDRLAGVLIAVGLGALLSAAQWVPTLAWATGLEHPAAFFWSFQASGQAPLTARELLGQLLIPRPGLAPHMAYMGLPALFLMPAALFCRSRWRDAGFFTVGLLLAYTVYLWIPKGAIPPFPAAALLYPAAFAASTLAAIGADRLLAPRGAHSPRVWLPAALIFAGGALLFYASGNWSRGYLIAFAAVAAPAVLLRLRWLCAVASLLLSLTLITDLGAANTTAYFHPYKNAPACYEQYGPSLRLAEEQSLGGRAAVVSGPLETGLTGNLGLVSPLSLAGASHAPLTREQSVWWKRLTGSESATGQARAAALSSAASTPSLLSAMAVRAIVASPDTALTGGRWGAVGPRLREIRSESPARVFTNEDALPRVYWVPQWRVAAGVDGALTALTDPKFDQTTTCVLDSSGGAFSRVAENLPPSNTEPSKLTFRDASCAIAEASGERVRVTATAPNAGVLVLADSFAPGWKATLDGRPCPMARANGLFRAIALPAGEHTITFDYDPFSFELGRAISLASVTLLAFAGVVTLSRSRA